MILDVPNRRSGGPEGVRIIRRLIDDPAVPQDRRRTALHALVQVGREPLAPLPHLVPQLMAIAAGIEDGTDDFVGVI